MRQKYTKHHRKCTSNGGKNELQNISYVPENKHRAWHVLTNNMHPMDIAVMLNESYLDPDYEFVCRRKP